MSDDLKLNADKPSYYDEISGVSKAPKAKKRFPILGCFVMGCGGFIVLLGTLFLAAGIYISTISAETKGEWIADFAKSHVAKSFLESTISQTSLSAKEKESALKFLDDLSEKYDNLDDLKKRELHVNLGLGWEKLDRLKTGDELPKEFVKAGFILLGASAPTIEDVSIQSGSSDQTGSENKTSADPGQTYKTDYDF